MLANLKKTAALPFDYKKWQEVAYGGKKDPKKRREMDIKFRKLVFESQELKKIAKEVKNLCKRFPAPGINT